MIQPLPNDRDVDRILNEEIRGLGQEAELVFMAHARKSTGRMARAIKAHMRGNTVEITVFARNPLTGYDYVGVTRFGHRMEFITPTVRSRATVLATGRRRAHGRRAALRFVVGGRVVYAKRVRGFKPASDWAEDAMPEIKDSADRAMRRIGKRIVTHR
jgi:hypothetical protein